MGSHKNRSSVGWKAKERQLVENHGCFELKRRTPKNINRINNPVVDIRLKIRKDVLFLNKKNELSHVAATVRCWVSKFREIAVPTLTEVVASSK